MSTLQVVTAQVTTLSDGTNSTSSTNAIRGSAKAWVNFNGTTSPGTINASYNVSSVTKNGTGDYTINFSSALSDASFCVNFGKDQSLAGGWFGYWTTASATSSNLRINHTRIDNGTTYGDCSAAYVTIFR